MKFYFLQSTFVVSFFLFVNDTQAQVADTTQNKETVVVETADTTKNQSGYNELSFGKPKSFGFITNIPADLLYTVKAPFKKKNLPVVGGVIASTALLIYYDQKITDGLINFSSRNGIEPNANYKSLEAGKIRILKIPQNFTSTFYSLGEGWIGLAIGGGLWIRGAIKNNYRDRQTASDLAEVFISSAIASQFVKRITGRESPFEATVPRGKWRPFPSFKEYQTHTSMYDAFPSGHLTTMMAYTTILAENYPEKKWIKPVCYSIMALTSAAMINTKAHWISDYPLALAIGYVQGKYITSRHKKTVKQVLY